MSNSNPILRILLYLLLVTWALTPQVKQLRSNYKIAHATQSYKGKLSTSKSMSMELIKVFQLNKF